MVVKKNKYIIIKKHNHQEVKKIKIDNSYDMSFKNKIDGGICIKKINLIDQNFIDKTINKRINKRFKSLLELIASICESDEDPGSGLKFALDETERFKREMINKYNHLLNKKELELIDKKIKLIEKEVKNRLYEQQMIKKVQQKLMQEAFMSAMMPEEELKENHRRR